MKSRLLNPGWLPYSRSPNDEAFAGHPLANRGLMPYGAFVIESSSWIRRLEQMNSAHPCHKPERFWARKHYVLTFHDSTFECVADRSEEHTSELQSLRHLVCRLLLENK